MRISSERHNPVLRKYILSFAGMLVLVSLFSCSSVKNVPQGQYLLTNNSVTYVLGAEQKNTGFNIAKIGEEGIEEFEIPQRIAPSEVLAYVKQKPNTKILVFFPFYLALYDIPDTTKARVNQAKRDSNLVERKTVKKIAKGKKPWTRDELNAKFSPRFLSRAWVMSQGEAPVILDSTLTQRSKEQVRTFMFNKGYFNAQVKDSVHKRNRRADVTYIIKPGKPYRINRIQYLYEDPGLAAEINSDTVDCLLKRTDIYDKDNVDAESVRLTLQLNNAGFYYFSKQYVSYTLDTNSKTNQVDVTINLKKYVQRDPKNKDSTIETNHIHYLIRNVTIQMNYDPSSTTIYHPSDSIMYDGLKIVYPDGKLCMKPNKFRDRIFVTPGDVYRVVNRDDTYTGLSQLGEFSTVSIKYATIKDSNYVDCYIQLMPVLKHTFGTELELTNTGGDGGIQGNIAYENYNQFRGAEKFQIKVSGGLIASQLLSSGNSNTNINKYIPLNTVDFGPEMDLAVPRPLFPFNLFHFKRRVNPQSTIKISYNYQQRPDYSRHILGGSYSFDYNPVKNQHYTFALLEVSVVNASLSQSFADTLLHYNQFFQNSFKNQFITDSRFSLLINNQSTGFQKHFGYFKMNIESSGLNLFYAWEHPFHLPQDPSTGSYYIKGLPPFSQYAKVDFEYRRYWAVTKGQKLVIRGFFGVGLPYANSSELPFTKSYWAGGSNDIRAWNIQTLGPGSSQSSAVVGQIGETKIEQNFEYRVSLIKYLGIALFEDAGNIWLLPTKANASIPSGEFHFTGSDWFMSEMALGVGAGIRLDFTYFVFRVDFGQPVRDPALAANNRFIPLHDYTTKRTVINLGIGYPF